MGRGLERPPLRLGLMEELSEEEEPGEASEADVGDSRLAGETGGVLLAVGERGGVLAAAGETSSLGSSASCPCSSDATWTRVGKGQTPTGTTILTPCSMTCHVHAAAPSYAPAGTSVNQKRSRSHKSFKRPGRTWKRENRGEAVSTERGPILMRNFIIM